MREPHRARGEGGVPARPRARRLLQHEHARAPLARPRAPRTWPALPAPTTITSASIAARPDPAANRAALPPHSRCARRTHARHAVDRPPASSRPGLVWRTERRARWFFAAHLQGALGTGAGYVALLLLAYEQLGSAWGATAVLIADLAPAMLLGPLLGGLIDRTSRLGCAIAAELIGALAFAGPDLRQQHDDAGRARARGRLRQRPAAPRDLRAAARGGHPREPARRQRPVRRRARDRAADRPGRRRRPAAARRRPSWCSRSTP